MSKIRKNLILVAVCAVAGLFSILPTIFFVKIMGEDFKGVWPELNGDRLYYMARIQEAVDGHKEINHPYFYEHKDEPYPQATGAERFDAFLVNLSGLSTADFQLILDFVSPFLIVLLTYIFFSLLGVRKIFALLGAFILFTIVSAGVLKPIHPQITFPLLLLFLIFWTRTILLPNKFLNSILSGALLGILFLTYFYHWSFLLVVLGIYGLICLINKDRKLFLHHLLILGTGLLIGIPYFMLIKSGLASTFHAETMVRVGAYYSHFPETLPRLLVAIVWLGFFSWFGRAAELFKRSSFLIILALLLGNVIYPNHQIISGLIIQNANHWSFMPIFIYVLAGLYILTEVQKLRKIGEKFFINAVIVVTCILMIMPAARLMSFDFKGYVKLLQISTKNQQRQEYAPVFDWINSKEKDIVILANNDLIRYVPAYTSANVYYTDYAFNLPGSDREVIERALLSRFFEPDFFKDGNFEMTKDTRILWTQTSQTERNTHKLHRILKVPFEEKYSFEIEKKKVAEVYEGLKKEGWNTSLLKKYRLDYIIWNKKENPDWNVDIYKELRKVYNLGNFEVYEFASRL